MKNDYKKILKNLYAPKAYVAGILSVPKMNYLMVSGIGHPSDESFQFAAQTLFPVAYVSKFILKGRYPEKDYVVMPMEVKWKLDRTQHGSKRYLWTMMIMQPDYIDESIMYEAIATLNKKKTNLPYVNRLRFQTLTEGLCGQILHIGPFNEPMERTFELLKQELTKKGYEWEPDSHDVYYNDIRKVPAEKLKTLIRVRIWKVGDSEPKLEDPFVAWE